MNEDFDDDDDEEESISENTHIATTHNAVKRNTLTKDEIDNIDNYKKYLEDLNNGGDDIINNNNNTDDDDDDDNNNDCDFARTRLLL